MTEPAYAIMYGEDNGELSELTGTLCRNKLWRPILRFEKGAVFVRGAICAAQSRAVSGVTLIGSVFDGHQSDQLVEYIDPAVADLMRRGDYALLLARYWGAYVAISVNDSGLLLMRDPSAGLACYHISKRSTFLAASSAEVLVELGKLRPSVVWREVAQCLYRAGLPSTATALEGVEELLPGDGLAIRNGAKTSTSHWSPWDFVAARREAAEEPKRLRTVVERGVGAWSRRFPNAIIGVSGGLDSSIVAVCLRQSAKTPRGVTLSTDDPDGDERPYARSLCTHLAMPLAEERYDLSDISPSHPVGAHLPRPTGRSIAQAYNAAIARVVDRYGAAAVFTGNGGDNVFAFSQSAAAIADCYRRNGLSARTWRAVRDISALTGASAFEALRAARRLLRQPPAYRWRPDRRLLARNALAVLDANGLDHRWLWAPPDALPGKAAHIAGLLRIQQHIDGTGGIGGATVIHPLLSQPIIETSLRIPSWEWCAGGRNRSVARQAFADALPPMIVQRETKGGPDGFSAQILDHHRREIVERLLDGHLAKNDVIDRGMVERLLVADPVNLGSERVRLLELLNAEAWASHWQSR